MRQLIKIVLYVLPIGLLSACWSWNPRVKQDISHETSYVLDDVRSMENVVPVVIIGSGPAGLSAALYVARAGMKVFVFAGPTPCGQLTKTTYIENWPGREKILGALLMDDVKQQAQSFGATMIYDSVTSIDFATWPFALTTEDGRKIKALSLVLATGATPRGLNVPGEQEYWGKGVTTCAVCDAIFFKNKEVVIAGGGDSAVEMVFELAPYVSKITMLVRKGAMRASAAMQERLKSYTNTTVEYYKEITHIYGNGENVVAVDVYDNKTEQTERRSIDGVFLAVGHDPNNKMLQEGIALDEHGYVIMKGRSQETSVAGVFAAGELQDPFYRQAIVAAGEGVKAALDATSFLYSLGFNADVDKQFDKNFFEHGADEKKSLHEISQNEEFYDQVVHQKGVVVIDFYHDACPGCIRMLPFLEAAAFKFNGKMTILKMNLDKVKQTILRELYFKFKVKVKSVPSLIVFKDGAVADTTCKLMSKAEIIRYLQQFID